jgi:hypothetical protein
VGETGMEMAMMQQTFGKEPRVAVYHVLAQEPSVTEFIIPFDQFDPVALGEAQFIGAPGLEVICNVAAISNSARCKNAGKEVGMWPHDAITAAARGEMASIRGCRRGGTHVLPGECRPPPAGLERRRALSRPWPCC